MHGRPMHRPCPCAHIHRQLDSDRHMCTIPTCTNTYMQTSEWIAMHKLHSSAYTSRQTQKRPCIEHTHMLTHSSPQTGVWRVTHRLHTPLCTYIPKLRNGAHPHAQILTEAHALVLHLAACKKCTWISAHRAPEDIGVHT